MPKSSRSCANRLRFRLAGRLLGIVLAGAGVWLGTVETATAQPRTNVGRGKCVDCHDHKDEKEWSITRDGDGKGKQHFNALNQLNDPKSPALAKAIGVDDPYDVKSTCVKCHSTVVRGSADDGVTCESCHGPGSLYLVPHQTKGSYQAALGLGMKDVVKKPQAWVRDCVTCHVLGANPGDAALAAAGHPTGADFDITRKYLPVALHFQSKYTANEVGAAAGNIRTELLAKLKGGSAPATPAPPPPTPTPTPGPTPSPPPTATPPPNPTPAPPVTASVPPPVSTPSVPAAKPPAATPPTPAATKPPVSAPPPGLPPAKPVPVPTPPAANTAATTTEPTAVAPVAVVPEPTLPTTPAGIVAAVQGRVAALLDRLLGSGAKAPTPVTPPQRKTVYRGPDADLLRLQEEVIALALEALGTAPAPKPPPPQ